MQISHVKLWRKFSLRECRENVSSFRANSPWRVFGGRNHVLKPFLHGYVEAIPELACQHVETLPEYIICYRNSIII